jgi:hypothetical protein
METSEIDRGPLRFIILAATGQDVAKCRACQDCYIDKSLLARFDIPLWEVFLAARQNDEAALTNRTIWAIAGVCPEAIHCPKELDAIAVARALRQEAQRRGLAPVDGIPRESFNTGD